VIGVIGFANAERYHAFGTVQGRSERTCKAEIPGPVGRIQLDLARSVEGTGNPISGRRFSVLNTFINNNERMDETCELKDYRDRMIRTLRRTYIPLSRNDLLGKVVHLLVTIVVGFEAILSTEVSWRKSKLHAFGTGKVGKDRLVTSR
jgi:hypothetical protein